MTRINLIHPSLLTDQHLIAEYRELPRIFGLVENKLLKNTPFISRKKYTLWTWHVVFFYDKLVFLHDRLESIIQECQKRGFQIHFTTSVDITHFPPYLQNTYSPSQEEIAISLRRLQEKVDMKPHFYTYYKNPISSLPTPFYERNSSTYS